MLMLRSQRFIRSAQLLLCVVLVSSAAWILLGRTLFGQDNAANANIDQDEQRRFVAEVRRELADLDRRHEQRIRELTQLRAELERAEVPAEQIRAVNRLIEEERRNYRIHRARLERWLEERRPEERTGGILQREWEDIGRAISRLNQSYVIPPVISPSAATGGSFYIDRIDRADPAFEEERAAEAEERAEFDPREWNGVERDEEWRHERGLILPPPLWIGPRDPQGHWVRLPDWLYREVPHRRLPPRGRPPVPELEDAIRELNEEVRRLREEVRELKVEPRAELPPEPSDTALVD